MFALFTTLAGAGIGASAGRSARKAQLKAAVEQTKQQQEKSRQLLIYGSAFAVACVAIVLVKRGR